MFGNINQITQQHDISPIQIVKQIEKTPFTIQFAPHNVNLNTNFQSKYLTLSADIDNHLNISGTTTQRKIFNIKQTQNQKQKGKYQKGKQEQQYDQLGLQNEFVYEVRNKQVQPTNLQEYVDQMKNKKVFNPVQNFRDTMSISMKNVNLRALYNQQGQILAFTANMSFDAPHCKLLLGTENVNILSQKVQMAAVGCGFKTRQHEMICQFNSEKTAAVGYRFDKQNTAVAAKLQVKYEELNVLLVQKLIKEKGFKWSTIKQILSLIQSELTVGFKKTFNRGETIINVDSNKILSAVVRLAINQNDLVEINCNENIETGDMAVGVNFIL